MKKQILRRLLGMAVALLILPGLVFAEEYEKKADNFIILIDLSGSMGKDFKDSDTTKLKAAKTALKKLNANIADLDYQAGVYTFTPFRSLQSVGPYNKASIDSAIDTLPETHLLNGFFSKASPLGLGILKLNEVLSGLSGKTVVYLVSDGQNTDNLFPYKEAEKLRNRYDVCFSVLSFADTKNRKEQLEKISEISSCSKMFTVGSSGENMKKASEELYAVIEPVVVPPIAAAVESYSPPDSDNDGIIDELDKCPNTPPGVAIDAGGCRIPANIASNELPFQLNKGSLSKESQDALNEIGNYLISHPEMTVSIAGHTCNLGSNEYNMALSRKRASTVQEYLVKNFDLKSGQVSMKWYGKTRPIASNATDAGRLKNRRVEINVVNSTRKQ